jgi:hypothetical protein
VPDDDPLGFVRPPLRAKRVAAAANHTCILDDGGRVVCWGYAVRGALGRGASEQEIGSPAPALGLPNGRASGAGSGTAF